MPKAVALLAVIAALSTTFEAPATSAELVDDTIMDQLGLLQVSTQMSAEVVPPRKAAKKGSAEWEQQWNDFVTASQGAVEVGRQTLARAMAIPAHPMESLVLMTVPEVDPVDPVDAGLVQGKVPSLKDPVKGVPTDYEHVDKVVMSFLACVLGVFIIWSAFEFYCCYKLYRKEKEQEQEEESSAAQQAAPSKPWEAATSAEVGDGEEENLASASAVARIGSARPSTEEDEVPTPWPIWKIIGLTVYRFYTGFLSATWLPYLLAMEGAELWSENQALFMAVSKLIYGLSILLTPIFGILGDGVAELSLGVGRRLFIRAGVVVAAAGIFLCHWAAPNGHFTLFLIGVLIWRIGEGLNDVTAEAICPELLPKDQFEVSSAIKASQFLVGGVLGYVMLACVSNWHYSWLYQAYLILMFVTCIPPLFLIAKDEPKTHARRFGQRRRSTLNMKSLAEAYVRPGRYTGGFPRATLCIFLFSFGAAPPFFLLLMLRDLVGMEDYAQLQRHFSLISIVFFLAAAVASALNALTAPKRRQRSATDDEEVAYTEEMAQRSRRSFNITAFSVLFFGLVCFVMPFTHFGNSFRQRLQIFYVLAALLGTSFGSVYARFQDCQWQLLPKGVEIANAMGYSTTWKLLGAGLGNFVAGLILDLFADHSKSVEGGTDGRTTNLIAYHVSGYHTVCTVSAVLVWASGAFVLTLQGQVEEGKKSEAAARSLKTS